MIWRVFGLIRVYPRRYTTGSVRALELYFKKKGFPLPPCKMFATWMAADATKKAGMWFVKSVTLKSSNIF